MNLISGNNINNNKDNVTNYSLKSQNNDGFILF